MSHNYCTSLSHLALTITGLSCFKRFNNLDPNSWYSLLPLSCFILIILHSVMGIWKWGNPLHGRAVDRPYKYIGVCKEVFVFPCVVGQLWFRFNQNPMVAYLHPLLALMPYSIRSRKFFNSGKDSIVMLEIFSCCLVSFMTENYFGVASAIAYGLNHFLIRDELLDMPSIDIYNYAFCFFTYFSYRALSG